MVFCNPPRHGVRRRNKSPIVDCFFEKNTAEANTLKMSTPIPLSIQYEAEEVLREMMANGTHHTHSDNDESLG
jgi:hypothetical protein